MRPSFLFFALWLFSPNFAPAQTTDYADLSTRLLEAVRQGKNTKAMRDSLATVAVETLSGNLDTDDKRLAFWMNVYNAHIQIFLTEDPGLFDDRDQFFKADRVTIAGRKLSFDKIEHGIIRGSKWKLGLGIIPKPFPGKYERKFRVRDTDPRIHLALNCGAKSCPPVAAYAWERVDEQLDESARRYLQKTTDHDAEAGTVTISPLFSWFRGDWGSKGKVCKFLKKYDAIPKDAEPKIKYGEYDWTLETGNYISI